MSTITLTQKHWDDIKERIIEDYGRSVVMISWKMKRELGLTVRIHTEYNPDPNMWYGAERTVRLDFYDDQLEVMFRLRYL